MLGKMHDATSGLTATKEQTRSHYCVYAQYLMPDTNKVFYLGVTKLGDVYRHIDAYRNPYWLSVVKDTTMLRTTVWYISPDIIDCNNHQRLWASQVTATCNTLSPKITGRNAISCIEGPNAGKTYQTTTEAAQQNGMAQPTLSNHLNGKKGYETVRGMKFKRGLLQ